MSIRIWLTVPLLALVITTSGWARDTARGRDADAKSTGTQIASDYLHHFQIAHKDCEEDRQGGKLDIVENIHPSRTILFDYKTDAPQDAGIDLRIEPGRHVTFGCIAFQGKLKNLRLVNVRFEPTTVQGCLDTETGKIVADGDRACVTCYVAPGGSRWYMAKTCSKGLFIPPSPGGPCGTTSYRDCVNGL